MKGDLSDLQAQIKALRLDLVVTSLTALALMAGRGDEVEGAKPSGPDVEKYLFPLLDEDMDVPVFVMSKVQESIAWAKDNCPKCGHLWIEHDFGVPAPECP